MKSTVLCLAMAGVLLSCARSEMQTGDQTDRLVALRVVQDDFSAADGTDFGVSKATDLVFETGDQIGVYIHSQPLVQGSGNHTDHLRYELSGAGHWSAMGSLGGLLVAATDYYVTAYYPYNAATTDATAIAHTVQSDQRTAAGVTASDFMIAGATQMVNPTTMPSVDLKFSHKMSKLVVSVAVPTAVGSTAVVGVRSVKVLGVAPSTVVNLATGDVAAASGTPIDVTARLSSGTGVAGASSEWEAIVVPQTITGGANPGTELVQVALELSDGGTEVLSYTVAPGADFVFGSGGRITLTLAGAADWNFHPITQLKDGLAATDVPLLFRVPTGEGWTLKVPDAASSWLSLSTTAGGTYGQTVSGTSAGGDMTVYMKFTANNPALGASALVRSAVLELFPTAGQTAGNTVNQTIVQNYYRFQLSSKTPVYVWSSNPVVALPAVTSNQVWTLSGTLPSWLRITTRPAAWSLLTPADVVTLPYTVYGNAQLYVVVDPGKSTPNNYTLQFDTTPITLYCGASTPANAVQVGNVYWATGNLIADGQGGCRIGAPADGGLYFQFGSLIGYKGGAQSNGGTGVGLPQSPLTTNGTYWNGLGYSWASDAMVWPDNLVGTKTTWTDKSADNVSTLSDYYFNYSKAPWNTTEQNIRDFAEPIAGDAGTGTLATGRYAAKGVGDPCTYYLGEPWRLPTTGEYRAMCNNQGGYGANIAWGSCYASWTGTPVNGGNFFSGQLFFPASGYRHNSNGSFNYVTTYGYGWSSSVYSSTNGLSLGFNSSWVYPQSNNSRAYGFPVRCVSSVP